MGLPFFMLMIAIGVLGESQEVKAANKLKVVVKKSTLVKLTDYRNIKAFPHNACVAASGA